MNLFYYISDFMIPILIVYILVTGLAAKIPVYDEFVKGAAEGIHTVLKILPTLVGLMVAVGMLRASGFLELISRLLAVPAQWIYFPVELVPLAIVRLFSSSAATSLALDIYKEYGTDSQIGLIASIMMSSSMRLSLTGLQVELMRNTSLPRTVSYRETDASPSANDLTSASPSLVPRILQISVASAGLALPVNSLISLP